MKVKTNKNTVKTKIKQNGFQYRIIFDAFYLIDYLEMNLFSNFY